MLFFLIIYDIACQWAVNFWKRVQLNKTLKFPKFMEWMVAIGKFHLAAHEPACYWQHTLNYMLGAGQLDGEIMETLWAMFNKFASMSRGMSTSHRKEILNDHMRDVNWKKLVRMGK
jgi:hypothetical protein